MSSLVVIGAVLCGGNSSRMGEPKALLEVEGRSMAGRVAAALAAAGATGVVLVGGDPAWADALGLAHLADRWPGEGPLGGLATAVLDAPPDDPDGSEVDPVVVVAACDQPWLDPVPVAALVAALDARPQAGAAAPRTDDGRLHPFPSAWRARTGRRLASLMNSGSRQADAGFGLVTLIEVAFDDRVVADVDRPEDLP